jgi:hypothetical protein
MYSIHIRGDNTSARARELGMLDFRELHPDFDFKPFRQFVEEWYRAPTDFPY